MATSRITLIVALAISSCAGTQIPDSPFGVWEAEEYSIEMLSSGSYTLCKGAICREGMLVVGAKARFEFVLSEALSDSQFAELRNAQSACNKLPGGASNRSDDLRFDATATLFQEPPLPGFPRTVEIGCEASKEWLFKQIRVDRDAQAEEYARRVRQGVKSHPLPSFEP